MPRPPLARTLLAVVAVVLALGLAHPPRAAAAPTKAEVKLLRKINDARTARGLVALRFRSTLQRGAHSWSRYLLRNDTFYHGTLSAGVRENIGWLTCRRNWPATLVRMWLASPGHRANLLASGTRRAGVGVTTGSWRGYRCVRMAVTRFR